MKCIRKFLILVFCFIASANLYSEHWSLSSGMLPWKQGKSNSDSGIVKQHKKLLKALYSYLSLRSSKQRKDYLMRKYGVSYSTNLGNVLKLILEKEASFFSWKQVYARCSSKQISSGRSYSLDMFYRLSKSNSPKICKIDAKVYKKGRFSINGTLYPSNDGCLQNAQDGCLVLGQVLETVFVKQSGNKKNIIRIGSSADFSYNNKNIYKVRELPCLFQGVSGPCGYFALYNLLSMYENSIMGLQSLILDRAFFEKLYQGWEHYVYNGRIRRPMAYSLFSRELIKLIRNKVDKLKKRNVMVSFCDLENLSYYGVVTLDGGSIKDRIRDFRANGTPQYLIIKTSSKKKLSNVIFDWDDSLARRSCLHNHWIALKIEWKDPSRPQKCPVILSVADSGRALDNRFTATIHWYYDLFVHYRV